MKGLTLEIEVERLYCFEGEGPLKAFADITIGGQLLLKGFRIVQGKERLFIGMPRQGAKNGHWFDSIKCLSKVMQRTLEAVILTAYNNRVAADII